MEGDIRVQKIWNLESKLENIKNLEQPNLT